MEAAGTNKLTVTGDLTIKGITKPVTLDVTVNGGGEHPMVPGRLRCHHHPEAQRFRRAYAPNVSDEVRSASPPKPPAGGDARSLVVRRQKAR